MPMLIDALESRTLFTYLPIPAVPGIAKVNLTSRATLYISGTTGSESIDVSACARKAVGACILGMRHASHPVKGQPWDQLTLPISIEVYYRDNGRIASTELALPAGTDSSALQQRLNPFADGQWIFVDTAADGRLGAMLFARSFAARVAVDGGAGNDTLGQGEFFLNSDLETTGWVGNLPATLMGGRGNDFLRGGGENDVLSGGAGNDSLLDLAGTAGASLLFGGPGDDNLMNENTAYHPILSGGDGNDNALWREPDMSGVESVLNTAFHTRPVSTIRVTSLKALVT